MNKTSMAILSAAVAGALVLTGCGAKAAQQVCVDRITNIRVDDNRCNGSNPSFIPWYFTNGQSAPRIGAKPSTGSIVLPKGSKVDRAPVPKTGGKVSTSKSGSGSSSKPSSGGSKSSSSGGAKSGGSVKSGK